MPTREGDQMPIVEVRGLTKVYGQGDTTVTALDHVNLTVEQGEFVAVMGPSGCGKSTLLNLVGGLDKPSSGQVLIDGIDIATMTDQVVTELRRRRLGFVFQFFNLIPVLTTAENAALPLTLDGVKPAEASARAREWLGKVGLGDKLESRPDQLSGGQQQRVAVARALVTDPALVLADEPTGNLDSKSADDIANLLKQAAEEWGRAIVMVTHDLSIASHARRILFMRDGSIVDDVVLDGDPVAQAREAMERAGLL
jgi:putative ABC transport system ATP-binding protein